MPIKPRFTFKKKFVNVEGAEMVQLIDLSSSDAVKNTHPNFMEYSKLEIVREMKEDFLSISEEMLTQKLSDTSRTASYELPDGSQVQMTSFERQNIGEKLFQNQSSLSISKDDFDKQNIQSDLAGFSGINQMIVESISKSDIEIRRDLFQNVILSGGTTMMKGFQERVQKQLPDISPQNVKVKVLGGSDRKFLPWVGGSILSSLGSFQQMWMSRQEYEEHGAIMIERKCP